MNRRTFLILIVPFLLTTPAMSDESALQLNLRSRVKEKQAYQAVEKKVEWDPKKTALIICDMWDTHTCSLSAQRVGAMAPRMNPVVSAARSLGVYQNGGYGTHVVAPHPRHLVDLGSLDPAIAANRAQASTLAMPKPPGTRCIQACSAE